MQNIDSCIYIHGAGDLGLSVMKVLEQKGYEIFPVACIGDETKENTYYLEFEEVALLHFDRVKKLFSEKIGNGGISCVVVCTPGNVVMEQIDYLLSLGLPLIICSTKYDQKIVKQKAINANISVIMSENMALPILDFWNRLEELPIISDNTTIGISAIESHQSYKKDISGSLNKTLSLFKNLGFDVEFDYDEASKIYKFEHNGMYGNMVWVREKKQQENVQEEFLDSHAYHTYSLYYHGDVFYIERMYNYLHDLENYSIKDVINFEVNLDQVAKKLVISHNINGKDIYAYGVIKCIDFIESEQNGVFTALDVINS